MTIFTAYFESEQVKGVDSERFPGFLYMKPANKRQSYDAQTEFELHLG